MNLFRHRLILIQVLRSSALKMYSVCGGLRFHVGTGSLVYSPPPPSLAVGGGDYLKWLCFDCITEHIHTCMWGWEGNYALAVGECGMTYTHQLCVGSTSDF